MSLTLSTTQLEAFFNLGPEAYRRVFQQIPNIYKQNASDFANIFFDNLPQIDPKVVRIICYRLFSQGIGLDQIYAQRTKERPNFLRHLNDFCLETLSVLLKYRFPPYIDGDLFFLPSLTLESVVNPAQPSNLNWLDYLLDLCIHQNINLNHINTSTGQTCLHDAVEYGSLSLVQNLLCHRVDPNTKSIDGTSPLSIAINALEDVTALATYPVYLNIIRQLCRYRAKLDQIINSQILRSTFNAKVNKTIFVGSKMEPNYCDHSKGYFSLDLIEDLTLLAELDPSIMDDPNFQKQINSNGFRIAIQKERSKTIETNAGIMTWPYFINDTSLIQKQICYLSLDRRPTVAPLPSSELVYQWALSNVPDIGDTLSQINIPLDTITSSLYNLPPTEYTYINATVPLPSGPLVPTDDPGLPELPSV